MISTLINIFSQQEGRYSIIAIITVVALLYLYYNYIFLGHARLLHKRGLVAAGNGVWILDG